MRLQLTAIDRDYIKATYMEDSSYIANYLKLKHSEIFLEAIHAQRTRVTLRISYERTLDPYWYFSPITRYGIGKTAEFLISEVIGHGIEN